MTLFVLSLTTGVLDAIVFPIAIVVFAFLAFGTAFAGIIYFRKYRDDHPYIPYAGQWAHVLCRECERHGSNYTITMTTGVAKETWKFGRYSRYFERVFRARCSNGHEWTYDPILERNETDPKPRRFVDKAKALARRVFRMRLMREAVHRMYANDTTKS